jgi:S-adenosylmethionine-diacylglycerol 3-amino-3-carboxypropyl transferase
MTTISGTSSTTSDTVAVLAGGELRYSTVWEDHRLLEHGLGPRPGDDLLVIGGAGDNVLNLLLREPRRIIAIDVNPAQSALVELQVAAISSLNHAGPLQLLGWKPAASEARVALYERIRSRLGETSRAWWDDHVATIEAGIVSSGRLERYIAGFRDQYFGDTLRRSCVDAMLSATDLAAQRANASHVLTPEFAQAFSAYFTAASLGADGRDPSQMRFVASDVDVAAHFLSRLTWVCTETPLAGNFYVERFFRGALRDVESGPPYLRRDNFDRLRDLVSRVEVVTADLSEYVASIAPVSLSHAALSDVFEYLSVDATAVLADRLARAIRPGGRLAYWNLFVPRAAARATARLRSLDVMSARLWAQDRAWFYRAFHVDEVVA